MVSERKKLDEYIKQMKQGNPLSEEFIKPDSDIYNNALLSRNLNEEALAREVLKNTGVPIPGKGTTRTQSEDFLNRIVQERYPELSPDIKIGGTGDSYGSGKIKISDLTAKSSPESAVGTAFHEAGHQYDDKVGQFLGKELDQGNLRKAKSLGKNLKQMDPTEVYELLAKGHHNTIPGLREGSYGFGALKSLLKNGKFKSVAPILGGAAGLAASTAAEAFDAEEAGRDSDKPMQDDTPATQTMAQSAVDPELRRAALQELKMRNNFGTGEDVSNPDEGDSRRTMQQNFNAYKK